MPASAPGWFQSAFKSETAGKGAGRLRRWGKRLFLFATTLVGAVLVLYLARKPLLTGLAHYLIVSDSLAPADVIYVMGGGAEVRPAHAAGLYQRGLAPRIAVPAVETNLAVELGVRLSPTEEAVLMLKRTGVPDSVIHVLASPGGATSSLDEAKVLAGYVRQNRYGRVIVVTSEFHTRRSRWAMRQYLGDSVDLRMSAADEPGYTPADWWRSERGILDVAEEFLKFVHNATQR